MKRSHSLTPKGKGKGKGAPKRSDPEQIFWDWVAQCTQPRGWVRYSPDIARALDSDRAALVLSYAIYLTGRGSGPYSAERWFYKSNQEWAKELHLPLYPVERALDLLCVDWQPHEIQYSPAPDKAGKVRTPKERPPSLGLIQRWFASKRADGAYGVYHYRVDWVRLADWWKSISAEYVQLPLALRFADSIQLGKNFLTGKEEIDQPVRKNFPNQLGNFFLTSEENSQQNTNTRPDDDDARVRSEAPSEPSAAEAAYRILVLQELDRWAITGPTAEVLADEYATWGQGVEAIRDECSKVAYTWAHQTNNKIKNPSGLSVVLLCQRAHLNLQEAIARRRSPGT